MVNNISQSSFSFMGIMEPKGKLESYGYPLYDYSVWWMSAPSSLSFSLSCI